MKFTSEGRYSSHQTSGWSARNQKKPNLMVNNFVKETPNDRIRSKSVLFSRSAVEDNNLIYSTKTIKDRDSESEVCGSPRSDSSRSSKYSSRKTALGSKDDIDNATTAYGRQSRSVSVSSDATMDEAPVMRSAWKIFEDNIKNIDDSVDYFGQTPKPSFKASDEFQKVMVDLYGNPEYGQKIGYTQLKGKVGNISAMASRMVARKRAKKDVLEDEVDMYVRPEPSKTTIENARRGWGILRRHVQEKVAENRNKASNLQWTMLGQTLRGMSNAERTRMDLYQRYGILPKLNNDGKYVRENTMLSQKARSLARDTEVEEEIEQKPKPKLYVRARSSVLPRSSTISYTNLNKQRPLYSRQRAVSVGPKHI
ncbi:hypothetical protein SNE40_012398 [Patella caerulea]|uniref:Uncharacterized protein n=1 Tax=Patella caerulea TaxID=87958 RepID=A0AAN8PVV2_PATCE